VAAVSWWRGKLKAAKNWHEKQISAWRWQTGEKASESGMAAASKMKEKSVSNGVA